MAEFGEFVGFESRVYSVEVSPFAAPVSLHIPLPGAGDRDFVFVPEPRTAQTYPAAFASYPHSSALHSVYRYLSGPFAEIGVGDELTAVSGSHSELRFAIVRWARGSKALLPRTVTCVQRLRLASGATSIFEIVQSTSDDTVMKGARS